MSTPDTSRRRGLLLTTALVLGVCGCSSAGDPDVVDASPPQNSTNPSPTTTSSPAPTTPGPTPSASSVDFPCDGTGTTVAVYYLGPVERPVAGGRLFREFHRVPSCQGGAIETAVTAMLKVPPLDPDYNSLWAEGTSVLSVKRTESTATIDISDFVEVGAAFEQASVQQLVWTVTAADPSVQTIRLRVNGATPPSGHFDWSGHLARDNSLETLAHAWILQPTQGATASSPVRVRVYGTGYEGNVVLKVFAGDAVVRTRPVTTMMGAFATASTTFRLAAGSYVIKAYTDNGRNAHLTLWDTKDLTVP